MSRCVAGKLILANGRGFLLVTQASRLQECKGSAEDKAAGVKEIKPRQPTGDDIYKNTRAALDKNRRGPIKKFLDEKGNPMEGPELQ